MTDRNLGPFSVSPVGLGCMSLSYGYGTPPDRDDAVKLLNQTLDLGYTHLDTAAMYGFGKNESLLGAAVMHRRGEFMLASKCGMFKNAEGKREINGRPEVIKKTVDDSLQRLKTDVIDLLYLHRWDKTVPIEDSIGAMSEMVAVGKAKTLGLSEVSAATLRKAHAVHPIAAVQSEYSLWTRNPELGVLDACREIGAAFVAFSPLARAFLTGTLRDVSVLENNDLRSSMPRFAPDTYVENLKLLENYAGIARDVGCTMGQLALAWILAQGEHVVCIPGTTNPDHLEENFGGGTVRLDTATVDKLGALINQDTVKGPRYVAATQAEIDTEEFPAG